MKNTIALLVAAALLGVAGFSDAAQKTVRLDVPGMTCALCPITVKKALEQVNGVVKVSATYETGEAVVIFDNATTGIEALVNATRNAGYPSKPKKERK